MPFSQNPSQMEWPFISQQAEIELTLLVGIVSIDLHVSLLCSKTVSSDNHRELSGKS